MGVPAPNDILRVESKVTDTIASICQVLMVISLCLFKNQDHTKLSMTRYIISTISCCLLYFLFWIFYYTGIMNAFVILGLTFFPCLAFYLSIDGLDGRSCQ